MSCVLVKSMACNERHQAKSDFTSMDPHSQRRLQVPPRESCVAAHNGCGVGGSRYELVSGRHHMRRRQRRRGPTLRMAQQVLLLPLLGGRLQRSRVECIHPRRRRRRRHLRVSASADIPRFAWEFQRRRSERRRTRGRLQVQGGIRRCDHGRHERARRRRRDRSEFQHAAAGSASDWLRVVDMVLGAVLLISEGSWLGDRNERRRGGRHQRLKRRRRRRRRPRRRELRRSSLREEARSKRKREQLP